MSFTPKTEPTPQDFEHSVRQRPGDAAPLQISLTRRAMLFSGSCHPQLATAIAAALGMALSPVEVSRFASGEIYVRFLESVRGCDAYVIQAHGAPVNEMIMEQLIMIDALKRASASRINAVIPYFAYARQDKKALAREPIPARLMADLFSTAGCDRVLAVDLHTGQIQGFFNVPLDHLTALPVLAGHVRGRGWSDMVVVAPDPGRGKMAQKYAAHLESDIAFMQKGRRPDVRNVSETLGLIGDVRGRRCVVVDDIIDTGGTIANAAAGLQRAGATDIVAVATHALFSPPARTRLDESAITEIIVTDTLPLNAVDRPARLTVVSVAPLIATSIRAVFADQSVSEIFHGENLESLRGRRPSTCEHRRPAVWARPASAVLFFADLAVRPGVDG
jgi:ribose-phosphate pyrophosphokinase